MCLTVDRDPTVANWDMGSIITCAPGHHPFPPRSRERQTRRWHGECLFRWDLRRKAHGLRYSISRERLGDATMSAMTEFER